MKISTKNSLIGKIMDRLGINKTFHEYTRTNIDPGDNAMISPVEAKVVYIEKVGQNGILISKNTLIIFLRSVPPNILSKLSGKRRNRNICRNCLASFSGICSSH